MAAEEVNLERWRGKEESYLVIKQKIYVNFLYMRSGNISFFTYKKNRVNDIALYPEAKTIFKKSGHCLSEENFTQRSYIYL